VPFTPLPPIESRIDPRIVRVDLSMIDRQHTIAEPRDFERPQQIEDDLRDCTPQALLRDLHRPDLTFDKVFEIVDPAAADRLDASAAAALAISTDWRVLSFSTFAYQEGRAVYDALCAERRQPWGELKIPGRSVPE